MSREVKFRAWDIGRKKWRDGVALDELGNQHSWHKVSRVDGEDRYAYVKQSSNFLDIQFYTGLKDKTGKEIYEGDIVKCENWGTKYTCEKCGHKHKESAAFVIEWENEDITDYGVKKHAGFVQDEIGSFGGTYEFDDPQDYEVIGNIHENKELLR